MTPDKTTPAGTAKKSTPKAGEKGTSTAKSATAASPKRKTASKKKPARKATVKRLVSGRAGGKVKGKEEDQYKTRKTLLARLKDQQDERSWEEFVFYYQRYIYAIISNMNLAHHDCEDLVQTVLLKAWKNLPKFNYDPGKGKFRGWITAVTKNSVKDYLAKNFRRQRLIEASKNSPNYGKKDDVPELDEIAEREWHNYLSRLAWENVEGRLAPKVKKSFLMLLQGKAVREIAEELELAENSVYQYKSRVQKLLYKEVVRLNYELS